MFQLLFGLVAGILAGLLLMVLFPDAFADSNGRLHEYYLSDHTRCVVPYGSSGISCDWERKYRYDGERCQP